MRFNKRRKRRIGMDEVDLLRVITSAAIMVVLQPSVKAMVQEFGSWSEEDRKMMTEYLRTPEGDYWRDEEAKRFELEMADREMPSSAEETIKWAAADIERSFREKLKELKLRQR
jgi:hypothetical protein